MKFYKIFIILILFSLFTCNKEPNKSVIQIKPEEKIENILVEKKEDLQQNPEFGPFFLPENNNFKDISINYFTSTPSSTIISFSMVGDIDWTRLNTEKKLYHKMLFTELEENTKYTFQIKINSDKIINISSIETIPYGDKYQFNYGIAKIENEIDIQKNINFLILLSKNNELSQEGFINFFNKNSKLISSTIIVPMFKFNINNEIFDLIPHGVNAYRYKNLIIINIIKDFNNYSFLSKYLSDNPDDINIIIVGNINKTSIQNIYSLYKDNIHSIFSYNNFEEINYIEYIENYKVITVSKLEKFALRTEW